jgi:predicted DNA-binding protein
VSRRRYTIDDIINSLPSYATDRAKIISSVSFTIKNYMVLKYISQVTGKSMSDLVNEIIDKTLNECEKVCEFVDELDNTLRKIKGG